MEIGTNTQFTSLLSNEILTRLARLRINSARRFTNRMRGEHLRGKGGQSIEFADYRDYSEGDDTRFVDWNIFSRLHRPYLKQFHQEEELHVVCLVDASSSMLFEGKLDRAKQLAAAFGVLGLRNTERVSAYAFNRVDAAPARMPPTRGRGSMLKLFSFLEKIEGGGDEPLELGIEQVLKFHSGRGVAVVLSDFLTMGDLKRALNMLFSAGLELFAVQILSPTEIDPQVTGDLRLVDSESELTLDVSSAADLMQIYQEYRANFERELMMMCQQRSGRFLSLSASDPIETQLFDTMRRKGWIA